MTERTDDELMAEVSGGLVDGLTQLFERHHRALHRFFSHLTGSASTAEDLTQEVFFRMLKFRETFQSGGKFTPWMYQIARNVHFDHCRKRTIEMPVAEERKLWEPADPSPQQDWTMMRAADVATLRRAFLRLPAAQREVLVLARYQELPYDEIARVMGCEPGTVKSRVFRAMKELSGLFVRLSGRRAS
ncbi:MAG: RNA polymerase sigma factor [Candidatus Solibacter usitatus]|nr:RNA polymerase sigma factor [Candidatus Solibacter usitatus]